MTARPARRAARFASTVFCGTRSATVSSHTSTGISRRAAKAPTSTTLAHLALPAARAMASASMSRAPASRRRSRAFSGIEAAPVSTGRGRMATSLTMSEPPSLSWGRLRRASVVSKATTTSAYPASDTMDFTSSPTRTTVVTAPPRWAMPWISDTFT